MDLNSSLFFNINLNMLPYLIIIDSFELMLLLLSMLIACTIISFLTSISLLHIHLIRLVQICITLYVISTSFRIAMIIGKFLGFSNLSKLQEI